MSSLTSEQQQLDIRRGAALPQASISTTNGGKTQKRYTKIQQAEDDTATTGSPATMIDVAWRPLWYRRRVLVAFAISFTAILTALPVLDNQSQRNNGIATADGRYYYLWTYGPTAFLTVVVALWNRFDYRVRQMQPWVSMFNSHPYAEKSILLDYLSPTRPELFWKSLQNKHWLVAASNTVGTLLLLLIILSTTLLTTTLTTSSTEDIPYQMMTDIKNITNTSELPITDSSLSFYLYDAIQTLGLVHPFGSTSEFLYQRIALNDVSNQTHALDEIPVNVLTYDLDCQAAELILHEWSWAWKNCYDDPRPPSGPANFTLVAENCSVSMVTRTTFEIGYGKSGDVNNFAYFDRYFCDGSDTKDLYSEDYWFSVGYGLVRQIGDAGSQPLVVDGACSIDHDREPEATGEVIASRQWLCKPRAAVRKGNLSWNTSQVTSEENPRIRIEEPEQGIPFPISANWGLEVVGTAALFGAEILPPGTISPNFDPSPSVVRILLDLPNRTQETLSSSDLFMESAERYAKALFAQSANLYLTQNYDGEVLGTRKVIVDRLSTRKTSVYLMESVTVIILGLTLFCIFVTPAKGVVPYDPASLFGLYMVLKSSKDFLNCLRGLGSASLSVLASLVRSDTYGTTCESGMLQNFTLHHQNGGNDVSSMTTKAFQQGIHWWRPITIKLTIRASITIVVIIVVIVLEVMLTISNSKMGITDVSSETSTYSVWLWLPALIMVSIKLYIGGVDSIYRSFAPYIKLKPGGHRKKTVMANYSSPTQLEVLYLATKDRQSAIFAMTTASILSSLLTIIVSGVFTTARFTKSSQVALVQTSFFDNVATNDTGVKGNAALLAALILEANLSFPDWTYAGVALTTVQLSETHSHHEFSGNESTLNAIVPAIRPSLNCILYDQTAIPDLRWYDSWTFSSNLTTDYTGRHTNWSITYSGIEMNLPGPEQCLLNFDDNYYGPVFQVVAMSNLSYYYDPPFAYRTVKLNSKPGCAYLNFIWGEQTTNGTTVPGFNPNSNQSAHSMDFTRILSCHETIERVNVNATFTLPEFKLRGQPIIQESSAQLFSNATLRTPYRESQEDWQLQPIVVNPMEDAYIGFFSLLEEVFKVQSSDYGSIDKIDYIVSAIKQIHTTVRGQQYNAALRTSVTEDAPSSKLPVINAELRTLSRNRLVLNRISTHILCGLLIAIILLIWIGDFLCDVREVLPKNPSSIVAMSSLIADAGDWNEDLHTSDMVIKQKGWWRARKSQQVNSGIFQMGWCLNRSKEQSEFAIRRVNLHSPSESIQTTPSLSSLARNYDTVPPVILFSHAPLQTATILTSQAHSHSTGPVEDDIPDHTSNHTSNHTSDPRISPIQDENQEGLLESESGLLYQKWCRQEHFSSVN